MSGDRPHARAAVLAAGTPLAEARAVALLFHGRGGSARGILELADELDRPGLAWLAPQADGNSWYPESFLAPLEQNQPHLDSALAMAAALLDRLDEGGPGAGRQALIGFSQGACLALELAVHRPRRYGGVAALTGGLVGPPGRARQVRGALAGTPVFLGAGDPDPHVPWSRVEQSAELLRAMGAAVTLRRYPGLGHAVNADELGELERMLAALADAPGPG